MSKSIEKIFRKLHIAFAIFFVFLLLSGVATTTLAFAANTDTSVFSLTINEGSLGVEIVDASYATVASPSVAMSPTTFSFTCLTGGSRSSGTFGTDSERIYVQNPDAADGGWSVTIQGNATTDIWDSAGTDIDFNDATNSGCADSADTGDTVGGQMTVDPSGGTITAGQCASCTNANISLGTSGSFNEGTTDNITLMTAAALSADIGDWYLTNVGILQTIPAEQPAAADYSITMKVTVAAT